MKEQQLQKNIMDYLTVNGWLVWKNKNVNRGTGIYLPTHQKGVPDLTALKNGVVVFIEVKTETGKLSEDQIVFGQNIVKHLGNWVVIASLKDAEMLNNITWKTL